MRGLSLQANLVCRSFEKGKCCVAWLSEMVTETLRHLWNTAKLQRDCNELQCVGWSCLMCLPGQLRQNGQSEWGDCSEMADIVPRRKGWMPQTLKERENVIVEVRQTPTRSFRKDFKWASVKNFLLNCCFPQLGSLGEHETRDSIVSVM